MQTTNTNGTNGNNGAAITRHLVEIDAETDGVRDVTGAAHNPLRDPLRLLADQETRWLVARPTAAPGSGSRFRLPKSEGLKWDDALARLAQIRREDGERTDVGVGALDKLAIDCDRSGLLHVCRTEQVGTSLRPVGTPVPLRAHAFRQMAARCSAPAAYLARLPAGLAKACLQHGLAHSTEDKTGMFRLARGEVRALVSARYAVLDDERALDVLTDTMRRHDLLDRARVSALATGARTVLRVTFPGDATEVKAGDVIEWGFDLRNGELGGNALVLTPVLYRLICTNGMMADASDRNERRRIFHVGDPERIVEQFNDALPAVLNSAQGAVNVLREATERVVERAVDAFTSFRLFGTQAAEVDAMVGAFAEERGLALPAGVEAIDWLAGATANDPATVYEVANAATLAAQSRGLDRRLAMEEAAGRYVARAMR